MNNKLQVIFDDDKIKVDGRELHMFLEVATPYKKWFDRMIDYGFEEGRDFWTVDKIVRRADGAEMPQKQYDHKLTIDMAKELCMLQRTERGKQARQYFIQIEKDWNSPDKVMARALVMANRTLDNVRLELNAAHQLIEEQKPAVIFAGAVSTSDTSILIGELAKLIMQNGYNIGQNRLFAWMRENGYLISRKGSDYNMPTQKAMQLKLFEIKERTISNPDGSVRITKTVKVTGKGQIYFINKFVKVA